MNVVEALDKVKFYPKKVFSVFPQGDTWVHGNFQPTETPPLKVWAYSAGAACGLLFLFLFYCYSGYGPLATTLEIGKKSLQAALIENNTVDASTVSVVILGSSLLERALVDPAELEAQIVKQTKRKTNVLRVALYSMDMNIAERVGFFKHITKYPPQYLFIENAGVNLKDAFGAGLPIQVDAAVLHLRNKYRTLSGLPLHQNYFAKWYTYDTKPSPESDFYNGSFDSVAFKFFQKTEMFVRDVSENETANAAYKALIGKTKIVFLDMPQSDKLRPHFLNENEAAKLKKVLEYYKRNYEIDYWPYPHILPDSYFTEGYHVNSQGAAKYEDWFVSRFAAMR